MLAIIMGIIVTIFIIAIYKNSDSSYKISWSIIILFAVTTISLYFFISNIRFIRDVISVGLFPIYDKFVILLVSMSIAILVDGIFAGIIQKIYENNEINKFEKNIKSNVENLAEVPRKTEVKSEKKIIKNDVIQMVDIRINNCFVNATKNYLNEVKEKWNNFVNEIEDAIIKGLVSDTLIVAASDNYAIVEVTIPHKDEELNDSIEKLENMFSELNKMYYKFVFINERKWNEEKEKYIKNLRNGYKYEIIPENKKVEDKNELDISDVADIFDIEKIEIE